MSLSDRELERRLAALPREAEAPETLWRRIEAGIETGIEAGAAPRRPVWFATAASVLVAALAVWLVPVERPGNGWLPPDWEVIAATNRHLLELSLQETRVHPAVVAEPAGWGNHSRAVEELKKALEKNPGDPLLLDLLTRARLREMELVNEFAETWRV
jgi:hypothetical protein